MIGKEYYLTSKLGLIIKYDGLFDFEKLRDEVVDWFERKQLGPTIKEYTIKEKQHGKEVEITYNGEREVDDYAKFHIDMKIEVWKMKKQGALDHGYLMIKIAAYIELDYKKKFDSKAGKFLMSIYNNNIIKDKIKNYYEPKLDSELSEIYNITKEVLELHS